MIERQTVDLADGQWHRLHPASPLLRGGLALVAVLGIVIANLRERILHLFIPITAEFPGEEGDPVDFVVANGLIGWAALAFAVVLILVIAGFYASWRMHTFRITDEAVEVRSGILFRTNRKARLDRIQGINIVRPMFARLFGASKLEINQAGQGANVLLSYLATAAADQLRTEILRRASGAKPEVASERPDSRNANLVERRVDELLAPSVDKSNATPESVVNLHLGRLAGSLALSDTTIVIFVMGIAGLVLIFLTGELYALFGIIPAVIGIGSFYVRKFTKYIRYSIVSNSDGIQIGYGLLSIANETLPPGRIHSIQVNQPLLWRPAGWWEVKVNIAAQSSSNKGADGQGTTTLLPVGNREDVRRVLELVMPELRATDKGGAHPIIDGLESNGRQNDGFINSPRRAAIFRPFSWRRNGYALTSRFVVLRTGATWRRLVIVPQPRIQSVSVTQGPIFRLAGVAGVQIHTVPGPISANLGALSVTDAERFFSEVAAAAITAAEADRTHRWRDNGGTG